MLLRPALQRKSTLTLLFIGYIAFYFCRNNLSAALPLISDAYNISNAQWGTLALFSELAYALGKFVNGPLADRFGGKLFFLLGMIGAACLNLVFAQLDFYIGFVIVWCLCRYFLSMGWGGLTKVVGHWSKKETHGTIMGIMSLTFQFGGVLATLFAGFLVTQGFKWPSLFSIPAYITLVVFVLGLFFISEGPKKTLEHENPRERASFRRLFKLYGFRQLLLFSFLTTFLRSVFMFWTPKILFDLGMEASMAIFQSALFPILGALGTIGLGIYTDKVLHKNNRAQVLWKFLIGLVLSLVCLGFLMLFDAKQTTLIAILIGLCGFFLLGPYSMTSGALTLDIVGAERAGTCTGILDGVGYIGASISVWLAGLYSDSFGWSTVFFGLAIIAFVTTYSAYALGKHYDHI